MAAALHFIPQKLKQFGCFGFDHPKNLLITAIFGQSIEVLRIKLKFLNLGLVSQKQWEYDVILEWDGVFQGKFLGPEA